MERLVWSLTVLYCLAGDIRRAIQRLPLKLYVKWIIWRDNMIDKLRRKIR